MQMNLDKTLLKFEEKININRKFFLHSAMFTKFWIVVSCIVIFYTIAIFGREILCLNVNSQQKLPRQKTVCKILQYV